MGPLTIGARLAQVAEHVSQAAAATNLDAAIGIVLKPEGFEVHLRPTEPGQHITDALRGFVAPAYWDVVGIVARGLAYTIEAGRSAAQPVVVVHLQARCGATYCLLGPPEGPLRPRHRVVGGAVVEVCRRSLGLPTDPEPGTPLWWWAARWLDNLATQAGIERYRGETELLAHFPGGRPFGPAQDLDALVTHGQLLASSYPWSVLRRAAGAGVVQVSGISAQEADWMDDGMFARWAMAAVTPCGVNLAQLLPRLEPRLAAGLSTALARWDLPMNGGQMAVPPRHGGP